MGLKKMRFDRELEPRLLDEREYPDYLTRCRIRARMTQDHLASACNVTRMTIYYWERGQAIPSRRNIAVLAAALGVTGGDIARWRGVMLKARAASETGVAMEALEQARAMRAKIDD